MPNNIFEYIVVVGTNHWYFSDLNTATRFINSFVDKTDNPSIYKLVYTNGELVKDGKR